MKQKIITISVCIVVVALIAVFAVYKVNQSKTKFNDTYVNGNTPGNLYNSGIVCENGGKIFFANPSDKYKLYSMNEDGSDLKKLSDDIATYINADEHYVYYVCNNVRVTSEQFSFLSISNDSLCRIDRDGRRKSTVVLDDMPALNAALVGNYIYYLHYDNSDLTSLYHVKIDRSEQKQIDQTPYNPCGVDGQYIYYSGSDGNIWRLNTVSDSKELYYQGNCFMPVVVGSKLYFLDCEDNYKLACVDFSTGDDKMTLTEDRIDCYNIYGDYIFFQRNGDTAALCRMAADGSDYMEISYGNYTDINVTSRYVYCRDFLSQQMLRTSTVAPGTLELFLPGLEE